MLSLLPYPRYLNQRTLISTKPRLACVTWLLDLESLLADMFTGRFWTEITGS